MDQPPRRRDNSKMKSMKRVYFALLVALLLVSGGLALSAQASQQPADQSQADSTKKKTTKRRLTHIRRLFNFRPLGLRHGSKSTAKIYG
jgi:hypothetical protein